MSFLTASALAIALFVAAPVLAHLLRRRQAEERPFPPTRLVPPTLPAARRRSLLEDRALFGVRALAVLALALLGATPFIRCSRLALTRRSGASVALVIVVDDSLSMRAPLPSGGTRWDRALGAARELTKGLAAGDEVAIVLAGAPARVALGSTPNLAAATAALDALQPSDRATDLDGALQLSKGLLRGLAQRDKRVVLLSDLADGSPADAPPLAGDTSGDSGDITLWAPLPDLVASGADCAVTRADRSGMKVHARVVCSGPDGEPSRGSPNPSNRDEDAGVVGRGRDGGAAPSAGRSLEIRQGAKVLVSAALSAGARTEDLVLDLPDGTLDADRLSALDASAVDAKAPAGAPATPILPLRAVLTGADAIAEDDEAPVVAAGGALPMAVVVDATNTHVATGGPPPIEQALAALELDAQIHPLPSVPEHAEELNAVAALVIDDVPGFTPVVRRAIAAWVERGGVLLLTLGPRAAAAPLGASFDPLVPGVVRWGPSPVPGVDPATSAIFGPSADGFGDIAPRGRASVDPAVTEGADVLARWKDGAPLLVRRARGRGAVLALTLPLSTDESDLALRPAFLALLERFVSTARARGGARRVDVGQAWTFDGYKSVKVELLARGSGGKPIPVPVVSGRPAPSATTSGITAASTPTTEQRLSASPELAGLYALELDGEKSTRVAAIPEREVDLRPRRIREEAHAASLGGVDPTLDISPWVALGLLGLFAAELALRLAGQRGAQRAEERMVGSAPTR